jgi:hypothetical protein
MLSRTLMLATAGIAAIGVGSPELANAQDPGKLQGNLN